VVGTINGQTESIAEEDEELEADDETETAMVLHGGDGRGDDVNAGQANSMAMTTLDGLETPHVEFDVLSDLQPPPPITEVGLKYHGSDSGLGTEPETAGTEPHVGEAMEYFAMTAQDMQT
jgi:hypothetical protein